MSTPRPSAGRLAHAAVGSHLTNAGDLPEVRSTVEGAIRVTSGNLADTLDLTVLEDIPRLDAEGDVLVHFASFWV